MLAAYGSVLRRPGALRPALGTALASLPVGMLGLSVLLLVQQSRSAFGTAGLVAGLLGLGTGLGMAVQGRLLDRLGQPRVLLPVATSQLVLLVGLVLAATRDAPVWLLGVLAFFAGACEPQAGGALRALWTVLVPDHERHTATALSSVLFEGPVVLAPLLLTAVLAVSGPQAAVLVAGSCFCAGAWLLATSRVSRDWRSVPRERTGALGALVAPGVRTVAGVSLGQGVLTGLLQVPAAAAAEQAGVPQRAPLLYAAISVGSLLGALAYGLRRWDGPAGLRLVLLLGLIAAATTGAATAPRLPLLAAALVAAGLALGPLVVCCFGLLEQLAPPGTLTECFTTVTAICLAGFAVGTALAGVLVDGPGIAVAFAVGVAVALAAGAIVLIRRSTLTAG